VRIVFATHGWDDYVSCADDSTTLKQTDRLIPEVTT